MSESLGFRFEKGLVALHENWAAALRVDGGLFRTLTEIQVGTCIPDLLIVRSGIDDARSAQP
jgi:hypothetical protein